MIRPFSHHHLYACVLKVNVELLEQFRASNRLLAQKRAILYYKFYLASALLLC